MTTPIILVTGAYGIPGLTKELAIERTTEYLYCLSRILSFELPTYAVVSETRNYPYKKVFDMFPFTKKLEIESTSELCASTKSQKEFVSLQQLCRLLDDVDENTIIIKLSGRYLLLKDTFINTVLSADKSIDAVCCTCDNGYQMYTFAYALRLKYVREYLLQDCSILGYENIERHLYMFIQKKNLSTLFLTKLDILANINNDDLHSF